MRTGIKRNLTYFFLSEPQQPQTMKPFLSLSSMKPLHSSLSRNRGLPQPSQREGSSSSLDIAEYSWVMAH
jgi:hypothetical protein